MKYSFFGLIFYMFFQTSYAQKTDPRLKGLDTMIQRILTEWHVPGISVAIVEKNRVLLSQGFGYKDYAQKKPVTEHTQFAIGSCTKAFTAALVGYAIEEKGIDLDIPIHTYFPELQFLDPGLTSQVTLRDMLCHRTGLPRHDFSWYSGSAISRDSLVHQVRFLEASAPLRQDFQYNNYMYMAIGNLLEKLYGKSWEALIEEKLFSALDMKQSSTGLVGDKGDFSYGYVYKNGTIQPVDFLTNDMKGIAPAGGISSTASDMAQWLLMWTNQGRIAGKEIISSSFYQQAISSQMIASPNLPNPKMPDYYFFNYGLGWYLANYRGHYGVGHGGNINGFSSFLVFLPTDSIGVYVSANQNNSAVPRIITNLIIDRMIAAGFRDWNALLKSPAMKKEATVQKNSAIIPPSHALSAYHGTYKNKGYGTITIQSGDGVLQGSFNRWKLKIRHLNYNHFIFSVDAAVFDGSEALEGEFKVASDGSITSLSLPFENRLQPIIFQKEIKTMELTRTTLQKYEGVFTMAGLQFKTYVDGSGLLKAIVPGQPEYVLEPIQEHVFHLQGLKGFSARFEVDAKGVVTLCYLTQPNGTFTLTKVGTPAVSATEPSSRSTNASSETALSLYAGEYLMGGQSVRIFIDKDQLKATLPGQPTYELVPGNLPEFSIKGVSGYRVVFEKDPNGQVIGFVMYQPNGSIKADKKK